MNMDEKSFRAMRRIRQQLHEKEAIEILKNATSGVLALASDGGYPYAVPVSHVYHDGKLFFHSALTGHKVDLLRNNDKVSFCVIEKDDVRPEEFTTYYRSVIVFGTARIITDEAEKRAAVRILGQRCCPDNEPALAAEIEKGFKHLLMVEITIDHITGKEAIELTRARKQ